jgi:hypothetical protein
MNSPKESSDKMKTDTPLSCAQKKIKIRTLTPLERKAELALRANRIEAAIAQLENAQIVTQDTLQLEFKI